MTPAGGGNVAMTWKQVHCNFWDSCSCAIDRGVEDKRWTTDIHRNVIGELKNLFCQLKKVKTFSFDIFLPFRIALWEKVEESFIIVLLSSLILDFRDNDLGRGHRY